MEHLLLFAPPLLIAGGMAALIVRSGPARTTVEPDVAARPLDLIAAENGRLAGQVGRLEERLASLERLTGDYDRRPLGRTVLR